jgi:hypothetical protein
MHRISRASACVVAVGVGVLSIVGGGCLDRPVTNSTPSVTTTFTSALEQTAIDKVDLLFVIDNSASMGDKQTYLSKAVPALITRLVTPNCVDPVTGTNYGPSDSGGNGTCAKGTVEFPPVHDMHIGLLTSSLGSRLGNSYDQSTGNTTDICDPNAMISVNGTMLNNHNDDRGELINRTGLTETPLSDLGTSFFLNWFPSTTANQNKQPSPGAPPITSATQLQTDFTALVQGAGTYGCGIESQLESWYRFLVQPDPYDSLALDSSGKTAQWVGVDTTILQQRKNFLRPDSLVAIIDLTDENDSEVDVRALNGQGWLWMNSNFQPPHATSACDESPGMSGLVDPTTCNSCEFASGASSDPNCEGDAGGGIESYSAANDWGWNLNLRHVHEMQKYGLLPQFPIQRYVLGLTSKTIPDRTGEYPSGAGSYQGLKNLDCTNPLFAASLPDGSSTDAATLCNLTPGARSASLIYYAHIGGVPHQLLQSQPGVADANGNIACPAGTAAGECPQKDTLLAADWKAILGNAPLTYDYTGIDPHMIESYSPRAGLPAPPSSPPASNPDPISGYEWITDQGSQHILSVDREYACTFPLTTPRDCSNTSDPSVQYTCDCPSSTGLTSQELPPLCDPTTQTSQVAAKAYPTIRELLLADLLGSQGIISSLCPIHVSPANGDSPPDPLYGYRPAMTAIVDRLKTSLANQCLPEKLQATSTGNVPCLILVTLPTAGDESVCSSTAGMSIPDSAILARFRQTQEQGWVAGSGTPDPSTFPVCQLNELTPQANPGDFANGSCKASTDPGWCYVTGAAAGGCTQAILFTNNTPPSGASVSLQCLEEAVNVLDASPE